MGCPPNPEEVELGRCGTKNYAALNIMEKSSKSIDHFFTVLQKLKEEFKEHEAIPEKLNRAFATAKKPSAYIEPDPVEGPPDNFYRFLSDLGRVAEGNYGRAKLMERVFCDLHAKFYTICDVHPELGNSKDKNGVQLVINNYIVHRKDDLNTWIAWLNKERGYAESTVQYGSEDSPEKAKALIGKIDTEIKRVEGLSEKEVLLDRSLFGGNPDDFEHYKNI